MSPAYDTPCSYLYGDKTMALSIGGVSGGDFGIRDFLKLGDRLGLPERATAKMISDLVERADLWLGDLSELPFDKGKIAKLRRLVGYRCTRLLP